MGEFGVLLVLGGNIPGKARVASIALYDEVPQLNYPAGHLFAFVMLIVSKLQLVVIGGL
jgi:molybdate transport system permease protein